MPDRAEPEMRFERRMTDAEALMWNVEKDPWLSSNIGTVTILDRPVDFEGFRRRIAHAVAAVPRMRERVVPTLARLAPPTWEPDPEFRLDYHVRRIGLPEPGTERQLFDLTELIMEDPLDRNRPLWQFFSVEGLDGGGGALIAKLHHTITDGGGGVRLAAMYMELEADTPLPAEVDLDAVTKAAAQERRAEGAGDGSGNLARSVLSVGGHLWRRELGIARRAAGDLALTFVDPSRMLEAGRGVLRTVASARSQVDLGQQTGGSPLWRSRSRHRRFDALSVPMRPAKQAATALGGSLNDFFVSRGSDRSRRLPRQAGRPGRDVQRHVRGQHPRGPVGRRELLHADQDQGSGRSDGPRRSVRGRQSGDGSPAGRGRRRRGDGRGRRYRPAHAHLRAGPGRPLPGWENRLRHQQHPRRRLRAVRIRRQGPGAVSHRAGGGHGVEHHPHVLQRHVMHGTACRSGGRGRAGPAPPVPRGRVQRAARSGGAS